MPFCCFQDGGVGVTVTSHGFPHHGMIRWPDIPSFRSVQVSTFTAEAMLSGVRRLFRDPHRHITRHSVGELLSVWNC